MLKPQRSTLNDKFSPYDSSLSLDQMKQDLEALEWKECPIQSVQVINPSHLQDKDKDKDEDDQLRTKSNGCNSSFKISRKKMMRSKKKKKQRRMSSIVSDGGGVQENNVVAGTGLFVDTYNWEF